MAKMKILVTGNNGYIGNVLVPMLLKKGYQVTGYDTNYYKECVLVNNNWHIRQIKKDIRKVAEKDLEGIDGVIHLAALSNDPLGEFNPTLTYDVNYKATINLAKLAKKIGVKRFIFVSTQSIYGISNTKEELDEDKSRKQPLTAYAKAKWLAEQELKTLASKDFIIVCFRPSTVFGVSPNLRCDIVFNNFVASAYTTSIIEIKSDGTPWRPVVHVQDVSSAFIAGLEAPAKLVNNQSFNVGIKNGNYSIKQLAEAAKLVVTGSKIIFTGEHGVDSRTYKVSFRKILEVLKDYYKPTWDLLNGGRELVKFFNDIKFNKKVFAGRQCARLTQLKYLISKNKLNKELFW